jgi:aspartate aminotransferase-like enzyme
MMIKADPMLMIPGPTPVPASVLEVLARAPIGHRSSEFKATMKSVYTRLKWIFQTEQPVFLYTASGTGAMEAALVNTVNPGELVLVLSCGVFSKRWAEIAKTLGMNVTLQEIPDGQAFSPDDVAGILKAQSGFKAVCLIQSETSTGVLNPVESLTAAIKQHSDALVFVDTVTSLAAAPFYMDQWGVDIAVSGSQKGFMTPPGLAFLAVSERAMAAHKTCKTPGYYFNFTQNEKNIESGQTPYTPAVSLIRGLDKALEMMQTDGLEAIFKRHQLTQSMAREAMRRLGLALFVESDILASPAVTSVIPPQGVSVDDIRAGLREQFGITIANGQKDLIGKIFRIGHLGAIFPRDMLTTLSALEILLYQSGYRQYPLGTAVGAAQEVMVASHD